MNKLLHIRQSLGWSQLRMARHLGCNQSTVCRIERGEHAIPGPINRLLDLMVKEGARATEPERRAS